MRRVLIGTLLAALSGGMILAGLNAAETSAAPKAGMIRHVVLLKFKDGASEADVKKVEEAFCALREKISEIDDFEWGTNNSPEGLAQGFTHCFFMTFKDAKALDAYLPHPAHKAFGEVLKPHLDKVLVIDYAAKK
jgi:hypothetical protein